MQSDPVKNVSLSGLAVFGRPADNVKAGGEASDGGVFTAEVKKLMAAAAEESGTPAKAASIGWNAGVEKTAAAAGGSKTAEEGAYSSTVNVEELFRLAKLAAPAEEDGSPSSGLDDEYAELSQEDKRRIGNEMLSHALKQIAAILSLPDEDGASAKFEFDPANIEQLAAIMSYLDLTIKVANDRIDVSANAESANIAMAAYGMESPIAHIEPEENAAELSEFAAALRTEKFRMDMAFRLIGVSGMIAEKMAEQSGSGTATGIPQAVNPADLGMSVADTVSAFSNLIKEELSASADRVRQIVRGQAEMTDLERAAVELGTVKSEILKAALSKAKAGDSAFVKIDPDVKVVVDKTEAKADNKTVFNFNKGVNTEAKADINTANAKADVNVNATVNTSVNTEAKANVNTADVKADVNSGVNAAVNTAAVKADVKPDVNTTVNITVNTANVKTDVNPGVNTNVNTVNAKADVNPDVNTTVNTANAKADVDAGVNPFVNTTLNTADVKTDVNPAFVNTTVNTANVKTDVNVTVNTPLNKTVDTDVNTEAETDVNVKTDVNPAVNKRVNTEARAEVKPDVKADAKVDVNTGVDKNINTTNHTNQHEQKMAGVGVKAPVNNNVKADINPGVNATVNTDSKANISPDINTAVNTEVKSDVNPNFNTAINTANAKSDVNPGFNTPVNTEVKSDVNPVVNTAVNTDVKADINTVVDTPANINVNTDAEADTDTADVKTNVKTAVNANADANANPEAGAVNKTQKRAANAELPISAHDSANRRKRSSLESANRLASKSAERVSGAKPSSSGESAELPVSVMAMAHGKKASKSAEGEAKKTAAEPQTQGQAKSTVADGETAELPTSVMESSDKKNMAKKAQGDQTNGAKAVAKAVANAVSAAIEAAAAKAETAAANKAADDAFVAKLKQTVEVGGLIKNISAKSSGNSAAKAASEKSAASGAASSNNSLNSIESNADADLSVDNGDESEAGRAGSVDTSSHRSAAAKHADRAETPAVSQEERLEVIRQLSEKLNNAVRAGANEIRMVLRPEALGEVRMSLRIQGDVVFARMQVENKQVKAIVESNLQSLKDSLNRQNLEFGAIDVEVGAQSDGDRSPREIWQEMADRSESRGFRPGVGAASDGTSADNGTDGFVSIPMGSDTGRRFGDNTFEYFA